MSTQEMATSGPREALTMTGEPHAPPANPPPAETRIILVDARPERRAVLRTILEHSDVPARVFDEADDAAGAIHAVEEHAADLVIIDLHAPVQHGVDAVAALRSRFPALVILVCSFLPADTMTERLLVAGADAYLPKPVSAREVMAAMREAPGGVIQIDASR